MTCLLAVVGAWLFWPHGSLKSPESAVNQGAVSSAKPVTNAVASAASLAAKAPAKPSVFNTNKLAYCLSNTTNSLKKLLNAPHAVLLENARIDTDKPLDLKIPAHLRSTGDPGAYIVQARGQIDARFRATLMDAGAQVVSYIPNNAYLVNITAAQAGALSASPLVHSVLPYEPYYKIQSTLLGLAVNEQPLPPGTALNVAIFASDAASARQDLEKLGVKIMGEDPSVFGPIFHVLAPDDWTPLAQSPVVRLIERFNRRVTANDLSRVTMGISPDTTSAITNDYLGLTGKSVLVQVNDSGVDATHPDFTATGTAAAGPSGPTRIAGLNPIDLVDTNGHGTHVAGIIAGNGAKSLGVGGGPNVGVYAEGSVSNADFRGKAPLANIFSLNIGNYSDYQLQTNAALKGALISNNSWDYGNGAAEYDISAASYDAATRDALPYSTGSQPVLFVFAAGNNGGGDDDGIEGNGDTILSPGTAKNVITVGALEQLRNITNWVTDAEGNSNQFWYTQTDSGTQVAWYSSRGNVGIGTEGDFGRFKPDVLAPGTFVVSTRSSQWDTNAYYNPTNGSVEPYPDQVVETNSLVYYSVSVPAEAVAVVISIVPNRFSANPFPPNLPIYALQADTPTTTTYDILTTKDGLSIPPDSGGAITGIQAIQGNGFNFAVGNNTGSTVNYDLNVEIFTTNNLGNLYQVLEGMNDQIGPYYRYETGTSMAAAGISGMLALIQDYFTNTLAMTPSPALMKALVINGARAVGDYSISVTNGINYQGWGLGNIQSSIPGGGLTYQYNTAGSSFFVDQSTANALATGDSHTYIVKIDPTSSAQNLQMQATLVWTDPAGDPSAAIKLVNNLDLIITNLDTGDVFYGNDISPELGVNQPWDTNSPPNLDTVNNVENILLPATLGTNYSVTVFARNVNVNAVTAQTNNAAGVFAPNIVQDFALVVSVGEGEVTNAFTVTDGGLASNPVGGQTITFVTTTNAPLLNQMAGANSPLMGTNTLPIGTKTIWGPNGVVTVGMTNQWHFYVITNTGPASDFTNAAFITFNVNTLSIPRMGVFADSTADATRPEADIDLYVSQDPSITNLNPVAIANCLAGFSTSGVGNGGASVTQGGTEFVYFTNSSPGQVYYVGVKSEDHMGAEYSFLPVFTDVPFGGLDKDGNQVVNGLLLPANIPDGDAQHPGLVTVFALAINPMSIEKVTVTNLNEHQNFGDLFGSLEFSQQKVVLNSHDGFGNTYGKSPIVYDDSRNPPLGTTNTDGPGSLVDFRTKSALGPWILTEMDNSLSLTGRVSQLQLVIQPHRDLTGGGGIVTVPPNGWFIDYVEVPAGYTNLTFDATNVSVTMVAPPIQMYEKFGNDPTLTDYDQEADLTNGLPPGNSISVGPPLAQGLYFVGLYNPNPTTAQSVFIRAVLGINSSVNNVYDYTATSGQPLPDDAVSTAVNGGSVISITATQQVASVNVGMVINSPRISDYTFTLVSPTGQRILLMENRGGGDTNGAGAVFVYTNVLNSTATGGAEAQTNYLTVGPLGGTVPIIYNFYTVPDRMTVYDTTNTALFITNGPNCLLDTGFTNNPPAGTGAQNTIPTTVNVTYPPGVNAITIIMNQDGNPYGAGGDQWTYTAGAPMTNYQYLVFTDDTNLTTVPIKFAQPPFDFAETSTNFTLSDFNLATNGDYLALTNIYDPYGGWTVPTNLVLVSTVETNGVFVQVTNVVHLTNNLVSVISDSSSALTGDAGGSNVLALAKGTITRSIATTPGRIYNVTFWYRGPGIAGWWRGEGNANDSSDPENLNNNGSLIGRFNFPAGEVDQAFQFEDTGNPYLFAGTNTYVQVPASSSLNVGAGGGFTVEGWINPTNLTRPEPVFEWLARVPTNTAVTNVVVIQGPVLNPATGHYYYLLGATNWSTSEQWAKALGGDLATVDTANEQNWIYDTFTAYGTTNRNLWIGYTNTGVNYGWISGSTSTYTNWLASQPVNCDGAHKFTLMLSPASGEPGLWALANDNGLICNSSATNKSFGVVEVANIPTNGVQFWVSGTNNTPGITNYLQGCLYANLVDTNYVSHEIFSAPGLLTTNVYQHVALTYNTNSGIAALYLNGTNVASTNLGVFVPKTDGDVLIGWDMSRYTNNYYGGEMDEMSLYSRALTLAEISAIYHVSADTTNRLIGKFDPSVTPSVGLAEALVTFGANSNILYGVNNQWTVNSYTFTAKSNSMPLTISGLEPGILLDSFAVSEAPVTNLYYLPEQQLEALTGDTANGAWTLQVWDTRAGAYVTNVDQLVNWQLSFVLVSNAVISASLPPEMPVATTVASGQTVYYSVTVPAWAHYATNVLVSSTLPVDLLYFMPANPPGNGAAPDSTLLTGQTSGAGSPVLAVNPVLPQLQLTRGSTYYLGVRNNGAHAANVSLAVDYDIVGLTNGVPFTSDLNTNEYNTVRYFSFDVSSNAYEATFQLLQLSGNADLVIRKGVPLPDLQSSDVGSFNFSNADENIYLLNSTTNPTPVLLTPGRWYMGVFKRDSGDINYSVLAKELDLGNGVPSYIDLTNGVPFNWTAGPGAALTNFFRFHATNGLAGPVTNNIQGIRFEVYNLSGNGDLTIQTNALPLAPPFYQTSQNGGRTPELVLIYTNSALTNLATDWYLGVPNHETSMINFTVIAVVQTNLYFPAFPDAQGAGQGTVGGRFGSVYHVTTNADAGPGSLRAAVSAPNRTVVFDIAGNINLASELVITNSNLTIAGQTSLGGITVGGNMTAVTNVHDVIIRDIRFRRGAADDSFQFMNASNVILDHVSAEWTSDNLVSVFNSTNVTVQWSIMADSLYVTNNPPPIGSLLRYGGGGLTFQHNLYADNYSGSPRLGDNLTLDFENNVVYNWGVRSGLSGGTNDLDYNPAGCTNQLNYVGNYLIAGPDTAIASANNYNITNIAFFGGTTNALTSTWIFQTNNFIDSDNNGVLNGANTGWGMFTNNYTPSSRQFPMPPVPVDEAYIAYERVLAFAGVNMGLRDSVDVNIAGNVRYQTGRLISKPPQVSGEVALWKGEGNTLDSVGANNGTAENGLAYGPGVVGQAFNFNTNANNNFIVVNTTSNLDVGAGNGLTWEGWIKPTTFLNGDMIVYRYENAVPSNNGSDMQSEVAIHEFDPSGHGLGLLYADFIDTGRNLHLMYSPLNLLVTNVWQHFAVTYNRASGLAKMYLNGVQVAQTNFGSFTVQTSARYMLIGATTYLASLAAPHNVFYGGMDQMAVFNRDLSASEIHAQYVAIMSAPLTYLDTDQDGIPDFWEDTFTTNWVFKPSNNNDRDGDGYTDLEEYNNWLAAPHALTTVTNPVAVDLYQLCGQSGKLGFFLTNNIHGTVYLTNVIGSVTNTGIWSNTIAVFTPTNAASSGTNYFGYASFSFYVTNLDTEAYFGPVPVSVVVSAVPIITNSAPNIITLTNDRPYTNCNAAGSDYYHITVTTNDYGALFEIDNPSGPMALVVRDGLPLPSLSSYDYSTNAPPAPGNQQIVVLTNSVAVPLAAGDWYMAAVNINPAGETCYTAKISLLQNILPPEFVYPTNTTVITNLETVPIVPITCLATDLDSPPLPLSYALVSAPSGVSLAGGVINWTPTETQGPSTNSVQVSVSNGAFIVTNTFTIIVEESNLPPVLPSIPNQIVILTNSLVVSNAATDVDIPTNSLTYAFVTTVPGANQPLIDTNGTITWTPTAGQAGTNYLFTTSVTDTNPWAVNTQSFTVSNTFGVYVVPPLPPGPPLTNVVGPNGINWYAVVVPTNAIFATNSLIFASSQVNLWFSTNIPPSITNSADAELLVNALSGVSVLNPNLATAPTNIVPGGIYLLGVQNLNSVAVTNALEVNFALAIPALSLPAIPDQYIAGGATLVVTNTATDTNTSPTLVYYLTNSPAGAAINNNGIITWPTTTNMAPTNVVITTVVTDVGHNLTAMNSFRVYVLPSLINDQSLTNTVGSNSISWFIVNVPSYADWATNILRFASAQVNLWYTTNFPPTITGPRDVELLANSTGGSSLFGSNTVPLLAPGTRYLLGVQNTNSFPITDAVEVDFDLVIPHFNIFSVTHTNIGGFDGYLLTWFAPTNYQFHVQWTPTLTPTTWNAFNGVVSFDLFISPTNSQFNYFDDGSQTGGFGPTRFYRLELLNSPANTAPFFLYSPTIFNVSPSVPFTFTNTAKDWDVPAQQLTYSVTNSLAGTNVTIDPNTGVISWTPDVSFVGQTNIITTTVTDSGVPPQSAVNTFMVVVNPVPFISSINVGTGGVTFQWTGTTNEQFQVRWTTNLAPPNWQLFPGTVTSPTGNFSFTDTNTPLMLMKFYQLILLP